MKKGINNMSAKMTRAQAALEFLTTYGWAFLVILIMIGTLAYFGILSPSKLLPNRCNMGSEFQCLDYQLSESGATSAVKIRLKNNLGEPITVPSLDVGSEGAVSLVCTTNPGQQTNWKVGEVRDIVFGACTNMATVGLLKGEKGKVNMTINYYSILSGSTYTKQVKGEIFASIT